MDYDKVKVIRKGNRSYTELPGGFVIEVDDSGRILKFCESMPPGEPLKPFPFTGMDQPPFATIQTIEAALLVAKYILRNCNHSEKGV